MLFYFPNREKKAIGFIDAAVGLVRAYLKDRKQVVDVVGTMSHSRSIECGVPQGSVLGPLFFLLFISDLSLHVQSLYMQITLPYWFHIIIKA